MKKIMFNDRYGLTAAVLQGRKTMTRRIVPTQYVPMIEDGLQGAALIESIRHGHAYKFYDVLAVAQNYNDAAKEAEFNIHDEALSLILLGKQREKGWTNKMFVRPDLMPHQIQITDIKIERLQDISDEDCLKEGVECYLDIIAEKGASKYEKHAEEECWIAGGDGENHYDQSISYCRNCAEKIAKKENKEKGYGEWDNYYHRDGGWGQEHDCSFLSCEECGKPLLFDYIPTFFDDDIEELCLDDIGDLYLLNQMLHDCDDEIREKAIQRLVRPSFASLIDAVSGKGTWQSNPFVFAYSFKLLK